MVFIVAGCSVNKDIEQIALENTAIQKAKLNPENPYFPTGQLENVIVNENQFEFSLTGQTYLLQYA